MLCVCGLQYTNASGGGISGNVWQATSATLRVHSGQLGLIEAISSTDPAVLHRLGDAQQFVSEQAAGGFRMASADALLLVRVDSASGAVVRVPVVTHSVPLIDCSGCTWADVTYLPLRIGWATTVTATQGLEFDRVLLDLNQADWLPGGGYTGVGRVRGDLQRGLRIIGGLQSPMAFNCSPEVRRWFEGCILRLTR